MSTTDPLDLIDRRRSDEVRRKSRTGVVVWECQDQGRVRTEEAPIGRLEADQRRAGLRARPNVVHHLRFLESLSRTWGHTLNQPHRGISSGGVLWTIEASWANDKGPDSCIGRMSEIFVQRTLRSSWQGPLKS